MTLEEAIEKERERNCALTMSIEELRAQLTGWGGPEEAVVHMTLIRVEEWKNASDRRLAALKSKMQDAACSDARLTQPKSESVSVHDNNAEHTSGPVMAPQAQPGTTRNAKRIKKTDLSRYLEEAHLTDKQYECASLRWEYGLSVLQISRELKLHRTTVDQHIHSAQAKMRLSGLHEKMRKNLSRVQPGE